MTLYRSKKFERRPQAATKSSSLYRRTVHGDTDSVDVDVVDLSRFIENLGQPVDLLKLDVEGAEVEVVGRLIDRGIHKKIGVIFAETHERHSADIAARTLQLRARIASEGIDNINLDWR
jgi:FkbM family methyltransferase